MKKFLEIFWKTLKKSYKYDIFLYIILLLFSISLSSLPLLTVIIRTTIFFIILEIIISTRLTVEFLYKPKSEKK